MYYPPGSVMAKTCVRGAALMYEYCAANRLPHDRVGKLIVAVTPQEHAQVPRAERAVGVALAVAL